MSSKATKVQKKQGYRVFETEQKTTSESREDLVIRLKAESKEWQRLRDEKEETKKLRNAKVGRSWFEVDSVPVETTIKEDDYQYRKQMREAMDEVGADMFSYNW